MIQESEGHSRMRMSPQSHGQQLLDALYCRLLGRASLRRASLHGAGCGSVDWSCALEPLPPRMLFAVTPVGGEFLMNTTTANAQTSADVVVTAAGGSIAVWASANQDGNGWGVFGQRFDASGAAVASEFQVNQTTAGDQDRPHVAADGTGNFVVTWTDTQSGATNVFARLYNADGTPKGGEFIVNSVTSGNQQNSDVAMESGGNFVVAWDGAGTGDTDGIYARYFLAD